MGGWTIAVLAIVVVLAAAAALFLGERVFAFLGRLADKARPTADNEARPGHESLGVGLTCVVAPIAMSALYDVGAFVAEFLRAPAIWPAIVLLVIYVVTPLSGVVGLLMWENAKLEWVGDLLSAINMFGQASPPAKVIAAKMTPPLRGFGRIGFQFGDGWVFADTSWINIRLMYERTRALGAVAEPWKENATWTDIWSR